MGNLNLILSKAPKGDLGYMDSLITEGKTKIFALNDVSDHLYEIDASDKNKESKIDFLVSFTPDHISLMENLIQKGFAFEASPTEENKDLYEEAKYRLKRYRSARGLE